MSIANGHLYVQRDDIDDPVAWAGLDAAGFMTFADSTYELINHGRTFANSLGMLPHSFEFEGLDEDLIPGFFRRPTSFWSRTSVVDAVPSRAADPANPAPWYDATVPASAEGVGFWVSESSGDDGEHHRRSLTPRATGGSTYTDPYSSGRVMAVSCLVIGTTQRGARHLAGWLESELLRLGVDRSGRDNLLFRLWPLDTDELDRYDDPDEWAADGLVKTDDVVLLSGPTYQPVASNVGHILQMTFTLGSSTPALLHSPVVVPPATFAWSYGTGGPANVGTSIPIVGSSAGLRSLIVNVAVEPVLDGLDNRLYAHPFRVGAWAFGEPWPKAAIVMTNRLRTGVITRLDFPNRRISKFDPWADLGATPVGTPGAPLRPRTFPAEYLAWMGSYTPDGGVEFLPGRHASLWGFRGATEMRLDPGEVDFLGPEARNVIVSMASVGALGVSGE